MFLVGHGPRTVHFYWMVRDSDLEAFQWFVHLIAELEDEISKQKHLYQNEVWVNSCTVHLFVTSAADKGENATIENLFSKPRVSCSPQEGTAPRFSVERLYYEMKNPYAKMSATSLQKEHELELPSNAQQDVWVWSGRPDWELIFNQIRGQVTDNEVGVFVSCTTDLYK